MAALATRSTLLTTDDLLSFPEDDGFERWLIRGQLRERAFQYHSPRHAITLASIGTMLSARSESQGAGDVVALATFAIRETPASMMSIDVALIAADPTIETHQNASYFTGAPLVAVEILEGNDLYGDIWERIDEYLNCGVKLVWIVDPYFHTITVYRHDAEAVLFNRMQTISAEPHLPGFVQPLVRVFE